tara:strand:+ start:571 stop:768 length:198 start_codon:yes stop_codon:yes gene_type:complete
MQSVKVLCEDNGRVVECEVIHYMEKSYMTVNVGSTPLSMQWNSKQQKFRASMTGLDFVADAPRTY